MRTSKEYRQTAWSAIKPVLPIMLLIFLVASLPQLIFMFIQTAFGLMPPMDTDLLLSDPDAFVAAYSAFMSSSKGITYSLLNTLFTLMTIPLSLGTIGAAQRILRGEGVLVRHSLAYIPYTFRAIWLQICTTFYAFWPMLLAYVVAIPVLLTVSSPDIMPLTAILFFIAVIATLVFAIMRLYSMAASDYLLARNMELGMRSGQYDLVSYVIASIATLCEGELLQSDRAERMEITRDAYLEIIYKKTASLLGISAGVGALSAGANREQVARMRRFGDALGMAFQIQDDILDFTRGAETGKPSNNDLREHKITLPLLLLLDRADAARRDELLALLARCREDEAAVDALQQAVEEQGGLQEASKVMQSYLQRATALLAEWPDDPIRSALVNLCAYVAERNR